MFTTCICTTPNITIYTEIQITPTTTGIIEVSGLHIHHIYINILSSTRPPKLHYNLTGQYHCFTGSNQAQIFIICCSTYYGVQNVWSKSIRPLLRNCVHYDQFVIDGREDELTAPQWEGIQTELNWEVNDALGDLSGIGQQAILFHCVSVSLTDNEWQTYRL